MNNMLHLYFEISHSKVTNQSFILAFNMATCAFIFSHRCSIEHASCYCTHMFQGFRQQTHFSSVCCLDLYLSVSTCPILVILYLEAIPCTRMKIIRFQSKSSGMQHDIPAIEFMFFKSNSIQS